MPVNEYAIYPYGGVKIYHRAGTDDDRYAIPELIEQDMYGFQVLSQLEPGIPSAVLDCGAHIGIVSLLAAMHFERAEIHAFEPQPDNYALLERNAAQFARIRPHPAGVGTAKGEMTLYKQSDETDGFTGRWTLVPPAGAPAGDGIKIQIEDLNEFILSLHCPVFLLKLDLEGYEARVIDALSAAALARIKVMILEEHHIAVDHQKLVQHGFRVIYYPLGVSRHYIYYNTLFTPAHEIGGDPADAASWQKVMDERQALLEKMSSELLRYQEVQTRCQQLELQHQALQAEMDDTKRSLNGQIANLQAWLDAVYASPTYRLGQSLAANRIATRIKQSAIGRWLVQRFDSSRQST